MFNIFFNTYTKSDFKNIINNLNKLCIILNEKKTNN